MITIKDIGYVFVAIVCFGVSYLIAPYGEQYQGMTGYVYDYGWIYSISHIVLIIVGIISLMMIVIHRDWEIPS